MSTEVRVPTLGESVTEATVATWFKKPGDAVAVDEMLCELETDKVTVEVPAPVAGVLTEIVAAEGTTVGVAALLAQISEGATAAATPAAPAAKAEPAPAPAPAAARDVEDAPSAKKLMAEKGPSADQVTGSGNDSADRNHSASAAINGSFKNKTPEQARVWADKQAYLALGFTLIAAAAEEIDATPMEGFKPDAVDEILGLTALGLHSAVAVTLGYRDAANDYLSGAKKVRRASEKLIIRK